MSKEKEKASEQKSDQKFTPIKPDAAPIEVMRFAVDTIMNVEAHIKRGGAALDVGAVVDMMTEWLSYNNSRCNERRDLGRHQHQHRYAQRGVMDKVEFTRDDAQVDAHMSACNDMVWLAIAHLMCVDARYLNEIREVSRKISGLEARLPMTDGDDDSKHKQKQAVGNSQPVINTTPTSVSELTIAMRKLALDWNKVYDLKLRREGETPRTSQYASGSNVTRTELHDLLMHAVCILVMSPPPPQFGLLGLCARVFTAVDLHHRLLFSRVGVEVKAIDASQLKTHEDKFDAWMAQKLQHNPGSVFSDPYRQWFYRLDMPIDGRSHYLRLNNKGMYRDRDSPAAMWKMNLEDLRVSDADIAERERLIEQAAATDRLKVAADRSHPAHDVLSFATFVFMFKQIFREHDFQKRYLVTDDLLFERRELLLKNTHKAFLLKDETTVVLEYCRPVMCVSGGAIHIVTKNACYRVSCLKHACIAWMLLVISEYEGKLEGGASVDRMRSCVY